MAKWNHEGDKAKVAADECAIVFSKGPEGTLVRFLHTEDSMSLVPEHVQFGMAVFNWLREAENIQALESWWQDQNSSPPATQLN